MKKLLTLLSAVSLTATSSASVVACGEPNDNGGGEKPPKDDLYKLNEVFVDKTIEKIEVTRSIGDKTWTVPLYRGIVNLILENNYNNNDSKIKKVLSSENNMSNILMALSDLYSTTVHNENFDSLKQISLEDQPGTYETNEYVFKMDLIHSDIIEANKGKPWEKYAKEVTEKMEAGTVEILIKKIVIKVI
ncbi:lipoprotein [Spiroplasma sp. BIUS-1]|uniref:lipoprotein n=1 Tax=Spiroplasma sp. BIUS-1 TaxID=216964 RepID=UPI00139952C9|nr:lipoprotein [Spiroplasma sp. BIUS-1]QHX36836.1 hypothetical protein SBIUS_v1c05830 [Spiroplasma sp. BIUS-1]